MAKYHHKKHIMGDDPQGLIFVPAELPVAIPLFVFYSNPALRKL
mgnify:CR=1 FL=1